MLPIAVAAITPLLWHFGF